MKTEATGEQARDAWGFVLWVCPVNPTLWTFSKGRVLPSWAQSELPEGSGAVALGLCRLASGFYILESSVGLQRYWCLGLTSEVGV